MITLKRTGKTVTFESVSIGSVFYAYNDYWTRTNYEAATVLTDSENQMGSCCRFCVVPVDAEEKPEIVECVTISADLKSKEGNKDDRTNN